MKGDAAVGVDIGGTKIAAALVGRDGLLGDLRVIPTEARGGGSATLRRATDLALDVVAGSGMTAPAAIGVASGGWMERSSGRVVFATNLLPGWSGIDLRAEFERASGWPAVVINDVHAMAVAEARLGAGIGRRVCLTVAVGTGIGGAITIAGQLFEGAHGMAGALGHIRFRAGGARCSCGRRGCIEAHASGPAIARSFGRCAGLKKSQIGLQDVVNAATSSDPRLRACAEKATATAGSALGQILGGVANAIDPDLIVLGGGAALALGEEFLGAIQAAVADTVLRPIRVSIVPVRLGTGGGVIGAGLVALDSLASVAGQSSAAPCR